MLEEPCRVQVCGNRSAKGCRGLCMKCYSEAKKKVELGEITWEELAELGITTDSRTPLERALDAARAAREV